MKRADHFHFRLYIAGDGPNSVLARENLNELCRQYLPDQHEIEVVDVLHEPQRALDDGVMLTPLLVKMKPAPVRKIVGSLRERETVLAALGMPLRERPLNDCDFA